MDVSVDLLMGLLRSRSKKKNFGKKIGKQKSRLSSCQVNSLIGALPAQVINTVSCGREGGREREGESEL